MRYAAKRIEIFRAVLRKDELELLGRIQDQTMEEDPMVRHTILASLHQALANTRLTQRELIRILDMPDKAVKEYEL